MNSSTISRLIAALALVGLLGAGCARSIHVLQTSPPAAFRTLGMVSGRGYNEPAAVQMALDQAAPLDADAIVVVSRKLLGTQVILTCKAIQYRGPPPPAA